MRDEILTFKQFLLEEPWSHRPWGFGGHNYKGITRYTYKDKTGKVSLITWKSTPPDLVGLEVHKKRQGHGTKLSACCLN